MMRSLNSILPCDILGNCKKHPQACVYALSFSFTACFFTATSFLHGFYRRFCSGTFSFAFFRALYTFWVYTKGCFGSFIGFLERCYTQFGGNFLCGCIFLSLQFFNCLAFARACLFCFSSALASAGQSVSFRAAAF